MHSSHTKREDVRFEAQSEKDIQMEELMASMKSMGMGANLYNREDMMGKMADGYGDTDRVWEWDKKMKKTKSCN